MQTVGYVMHRGVITCSPHAPVAAIARTMAAHRIHCVVVPGHGIVTDLELTVGLDGPAETTAAALARSAPMLVQSETVERAAALMRTARATHALVVEGGSNRLVGVLSTLDLANALALR
jgi:CBS domain-containing protein